MAIISTGSLLSQYMESNGVTISQVADFCNVTNKTVYRLINDETRLTPEYAFAIEKLIPGLKGDFLLKYDAVYQYQRLQIEKQINLDIDKCISVFRLKKLFPDLASDKQALIERGIQVFGEKSLASGVIPVPVFAQYSKANNASDDDSNLWAVTAYKECLEKYTGKNRVFSQGSFDKEFGRIKELCGTTSYDNTIFNMEEFCENCGIYFYIRPSITNARIKGMAIRDIEGRVCIILSDLFKCVEVLWLSFIHECIHIQNEDFNKTELVVEKNMVMNENYVSQETMCFFVSVDEIKNNANPGSILELSKRVGAPTGVIAAIARYATSTYSNKELNSFLHFS